MLQPRRSRPRTKQETGQAIVIIALGFVMLLAFSGLVVDVARVFVARAQLRRAVDAAGLAATSKFRTGATGEIIQQSALDLLRVNGVEDPEVIIETCSLEGTTLDESLCTNPARKLVRVRASAEVPMVFMQLVNFPTVSVAADSIAEAASVDAVLVLDNSESQSYSFGELPSPYNEKCSQSNVNDIYACLNGGTLSDGSSITGCNEEPITDPAHLAEYPELTRGICQPFLKTKEAAYKFIQRLYQGYDRVGIINFNENANRLVPLTFDFNTAIDLINDMDVYVNRPDGADGHIACNSSTPAAEAWKCGSSNIGAGIILGHDEFGQTDHPYREDSLWVILLLVDGPANRTSYDSRIAWSDVQYGTCPESEQAPRLKCRDADANSRHWTQPVVDPLYDADDYARDYADITGLDSEEYTGLGATGILLYTIALGRNAVCVDPQASYTAPVDGSAAICTGSRVDFGDPDAGEQLLRYIADIGDDGNPATGPCLDRETPFRNGDPTSGTFLTDPSGRSDDAPLGVQCGNYYFAPDATELQRIFLEIAGRIFTRLSG